MTRFAILVGLALLLAPLASAVPLETAPATSVLGPIIEPIQELFAWLTELFGPSSIEIPETPGSNYGAEIIPNG